jgi:hypothetical protein
MKCAFPPRSSLVTAAFVLILVGLAFSFRKSPARSAPITATPAAVTQPVASLVASDPVAPQPSLAVASAVTPSIKTAGTEAVLDAFTTWTGQYLAAPAVERKKLEPEGIRLATTRRPIFKAIIQNDPQRAIERSVPRVVRQDLPESITALLEKPVSATGDLNVYRAKLAPGVPVPAEGLVLRYFEAKDLSFKAHVYGGLTQVMSKKGIPLRGVALDRDFAVADNAVRRLEVGERIPEGVAVEQICPVSGTTTVAPSVGQAATEHTPTVEIGARLITLCNGSHVTVLENDFKTYVQARGPGGAGFFMDSFPGTASRAIGNLRCLYIRVTYPDQLAQPNTEERAYSDMADSARFFLENSYGKLTQTSTITPLVVLPHTLAWYNAKESELDTLGLIQTHSRDAARARGYDSTVYDCIIVRINQGPQLVNTSWGGGDSVWVTWDGMDVLNHEIGHSLDLDHANFWRSLDGTSYGFGESEEYGNVFDVMGGGYGFGVHYNTITKRLLNWLPDNFIHQPKGDGVFRIYAYDQPTLESGKRYGLSVAKDSVRQYNIEFHPAAGGYLAENALVIYSGMGSPTGHLLDTTQGSLGGKKDGGIAIGRTYSDWEADMHFTVLSKNGTSPESLDIAYNRGPFPGNVAPAATLAASATTIAIGSSVTFTATASDANGDALAYHWQFDDGVTGTNSPVFTRTFPTAAKVNAMLTVSDMKGGTVRRSVVITVGSPTTQTITGTVSVGGQGLSGVYLTGGGKACYSNADGTYALAGVATGPKALTAVLAGATFSPSFTNPLTVIAGTNTANWTAADSALVTLTRVADATEGGASGTFQLTRTGSTTAALTVLVSPAGGTASKGTDYTFTPTYVATGSFYAFTIPAGSSTLDVNVAAIDDTLAEGPETITLQLAGAAGYFSKSGNSAVMTVVDNDTSLPQVSVTAPVPYATEAGATGNFTFTRTGPTTASLTLAVAWSGTATNGSDYSILAGTVTIPAGQSSVNVKLPPINDTQIEGLETVIASISSNAAYVPDSAATTATVIITDDDLPMVSVSVPDPSASEAGADSGVFLLTRTGSTAAPLKVYYGLSGSASHGTDYAPLTAEVTIPAGQTTAPVVITPYNDDIAEPAETVTLAVASFEDTYSIGTPNQGTVTLLDNNDTPLINVRAGTAGTEGGDNATFIFKSIGHGSGNLTVNYTVSGTATPGVDYTALSGSISVPVNGSNDTTLTVPILNDTLAEPTETVVIKITPSPNYRVYNDGSAEVVIRDNDSGDRVMVSTYNQSPAEAGSVPGTFYFSRTGSTGALTVNYAISGTATNGVDYQTLSGSVVIPDTQTGVNLVMTPIADALAEGPETVTLTVLPGTGYGPDRPASATYEISDNETPSISVGFQQAVLPTTEQPGPLGEYRDLAVVLSASSANTVTVQFRSAGGDAAGDGEDWAFIDAANGNAVIPGGTLTFPPGVTSQNIRIRIKNDGIREGMESAVLQLFSPWNARLTSGKSQETILIFDDVISVLVTEERWNTPSVYTKNTWSTVPPDYTGVLVGFTSAQNVGDDFSRQLTGQIIAPVTGTYTFWIAGDNNCRLFLSTTSSAANKVQIASKSGWTDFQAWDDNASQKSAVINLVAGQSYYLEVQHQEGDGVDHVSVAWQGPGFNRTPVVIAAASDNAPRTVRMAVAASTHLESDGSDSMLMVILDRPAGTTPVTVNYSASGTATPGSDYLFSPGTLSFGPGEQMKIIPLTLLNDALNEPAETIIIALANPVGATLAAPATNTLTLLDAGLTLLDAGLPVVAPLFGTAASSQPAGTVIATVTATLATGRTAVGWSILSGNTANAFAINASGQLTLAAPAALPKPGGVQLLVRVTDSVGATATGLLFIVCNPGAQPVVEQRWAGNTAFDNQDWTGTPSYSGTLATLTTPQDVADNYSRRLTGFLKPQVTGDYTFWIAADDHCRLFLSTDGYQAHKVQIASKWVGTYFQNWDASPTQKSVVIPLVAGVIYWIEAHQVEGKYGDQVSVAWSGPGISREAIPSTVLFAMAPGIDFLEPAATTTNAVPFISGLTDLGIPTGTSSGTVSFTVGDVETPAGSLVVSGSSSDLTLVPNANIVFGGSGANRTVTITPVPNQTGSATITLTVNDGLLTSDYSLVIAVGPNQLVSFQLAASSGLEAVSPAEIDVSMNMVRETSVSVDFVLTGGTVTNGTDYTFTAGTLVFAPGETRKTIPVTIINDSIAEGDETLQLSLSNPVGAVLGTNTTHTYTILDDDPNLSITASDSSAAESGPNTGQFTLTRTGITTGAITVNLSIGGTAVNGTDYTMIPSTVAFAAGQTSQTITVTPIDDSEYETTETVTVGIAAGTGYRSAANATATVTIADNDLPKISIAATDASASEAGPDTGLFTVTRNGDTGTALNITLAITGTATPGTDYMAIPGTVSFPIGAATVTVPVTPLADMLAESAETVIASLQANAAYTVADAPGNAATVTIANEANATAFNEWIAVYTFAAGTDKTATGDPDGDGVSNLVEYALGLDPTVANANPIQLSQVNVAGNTYLQLKVSRNPAATHVLIEGLSAGTLTDVTTWSTATTVIVTDTASEFVVRDSQAIGTGLKRFLKLRFTLQR